MIHDSNISISDAARISGLLSLLVLRDLLMVLNSRRGTGTPVVSTPLNVSCREHFEWLLKGLSSTLIVGLCM